MKMGLMGNFFVLILTIILVAACSSAPLKQTKQGVAYSDSHLPFSEWGRSKQCCAAKGEKIAVASGGAQASKIGVNLYERGGNIVDVVVGVAFALAVELPGSAGLGGGGFLTLHLGKEKDKNFFIDFRETAPRKATRDMYLDLQGNVIERLSLDSVLAVGTPGFVAGMYEAHKRWGSLPWQQVIAPAVRLAQRGVLVTRHLIEAIQARKAVLLSQPYTRQLLFRGGKALKRGSWLVQRDLAKTLRAIAKQGTQGFYGGGTARAIAKFVKDRGGILDEIDLKKYRAKFRYPLGGRFGGYTFVSAPPPSAGGILLAQMLGVLSAFPLKEEAQSSFDGYLHLLVETMSQAYADRSVAVGDTDFVKTPYLPLINPQYVETIRDNLDLSRHKPSVKVRALAGLPKMDGNTTHFSIIDGKGNAASCTLTINTEFGSGLAVPGTGVFLNSEMDDFSVKPGSQNHWGLTGGESNAIAPLKRPVSSMSPTIVFKAGQPILAVGARGGAKIISSVLQIILNNTVLYPKDLQASLFAPRIHFQWLPDKLYVETNGFPQGVRRELAEKGHQVVVREGGTLAHAVQRDPKTGKLTAVFDPRGPGGAEAR